jgi:hypothetical protein
MPRSSAPSTRIGLNTRRDRLKGACNLIARITNIHHFNRTRSNQFRIPARLAAVAKQSGQAVLRVGAFTSALIPMPAEAMHLRGRPLSEGDYHEQARRVQQQRRSSAWGAAFTALG